MVDCRLVPQVAGQGISARHYRAPGHAAVHDAIIDTWIETRGQTDAVTVGEHLCRHGQLESVGGCETLASLLESAAPQGLVSRLIEHMRSR